jgi:hypothetical protein
VFEGAICLTCGKWLIEWRDKVRLRCVALGEAQNVEAIEMIGQGFCFAGLGDEVGMEWWKSTVDVMGHWPLLWGSQCRCDR